MLCPEGAATLAAYKQAIADGLINADDEAVLFNCGSGLKYPMPEVSASLDHTGEIDWDALER